jgi:D-glycero-D-manno-heptose 1,7-bisphosphate phosphatase
MPSDRAVFLDRDGTINRNRYYPDSGEFEGPRSADEFELYPWSIPALAALSQAGYSLIVVSNQPNFAKGKSTLESLLEIQERLVRELKNSGTQLLDSYYCYHHPESLVPGFSKCSCRKPSPDFIFAAVRSYGIDVSRSWMVGDRPTDIECGYRAGLRTIRIEPDHPSADPHNDWPKAHYYAADLLAASRIILNEE